MATEGDIFLNVNIERVDDVAVVHLEGEVHVPGADVLRDHLLTLVAEELPVIVLDLGSVAFIGSAGLGAIVLAHIKGRAYQGELRLVDPQPKVQRALDITRLTKLFKVFGSVDEAIAG